MHVLYEKVVGGLPGSVKVSHQSWEYTEIISVVCQMGKRYLLSDI